MHDAKAMSKTEDPQAIEQMHSLMGGMFASISGRGLKIHFAGDQRREISAAQRVALRA